MTDFDLIGLSGKKRSGKDTFAGALLDAGWARYAFADPMKEALLDVAPYVGSKWGGYWHGTDIDEVADIPRLSTLVESEGWEAAKDWSEVRRLLQKFGHAIRALSPDFWVDVTMARVAAHDGPVVVTDVRMPNEADAIRAAGGIIVRVERPSIQSDDTHSSETALDDYGFDAVVYNEGSIADLREKARRICL